MSDDDRRPLDRASLRTALEIAIRVALLLLLIIWSFMILRPFVVPILWGVIIAVAIYPAFVRFSGALGNRPKTAAVLSGLLMLILLIVPATMLADTLIDSARDVNDMLGEGGLNIPPPPERVETWPLIGPGVHEFWTLASVNLEAALKQIWPQIRIVVRWLVATAGGVGIGMLQFALAIAISGVLLAHAEGGGSTMRAIANRLIGQQGWKFVDLATATVRGVTLGILAVALIQAILAGLGLLVVGVPAAGLLALLCVLFAIIQIGVGPVLIPTAIYVFATADTLTAVLFLIWSIFVTVIDNVLKPILLGRGGKVPMPVIFLGAIGGFITHGFIGLFIGSVVLAIAYALYRAWMADAAARAGGGEIALPAPDAIGPAERDAPASP